MQQYLSVIAWTPAQRDFQRHTAVELSVRPSCCCTAGTKTWSSTNRMPSVGQEVVITTTQCEKQPLRSVCSFPLLSFRRKRRNSYGPSEGGPSPRVCSCRGAASCLTHTLFHTPSAGHSAFSHHLQSISKLESLQLLANWTSDASFEPQVTLRRATSVHFEPNMADQTLVRPDTVDNKDGQEGSEVRCLT